MRQQRIFRRKKGTRLKREKTNVNDHPRNVEEGMQQFDSRSSEELYRGDARKVSRGVVKEHRGGMGQGGRSSASGFSENQRIELR